jgi:signal peptidase I
MPLAVSEAVASMVMSEDSALTRLIDLERRLDGGSVDAPTTSAGEDDLIAGTAEFDQPVDDTPEATKRPRSALSVLLEWIVVVAVAIASALLVSAYVVRQFAVEGRSMDATLADGDRVLVNRLSYRLHDPRRGDVVVLHRVQGEFTERDLIKRIVGLPGEAVEIRDCSVYIDGRLLIEPYLDPVTVPNGCTDGGQQAYPFVVPEDHVFVMGDNRDESGDSRAFGAVPYDDLVGRAFVVVWPVGDWKWL